MFEITSFHYFSNILSGLRVNKGYSAAQISSFFGISKNFFTVMVSVDLFQTPIPISAPMQLNCWGEKLAVLKILLESSSTFSTRTFFSS
jgi:hypothetical protein